jgi:two-component sensor histidine kinase
VLGSYDIDFRILEGDATRWISARGRGDDMGIVGRIMFGVFLDVTERKRAEELHELLAREMSHRVKNLFALAAALSTISARSTSSSEEMAKDFTQRLTSLSHAHDLVRPNAGEADGRTTFLQDMFEVLLAPYDDRTRRRIHIALPNVPVGEGAVTALALIVHELATNSMKYGALSAAAGNIKIFGAVDADEVSLTWRERGGPAVPGRPERTGFGSVLVSQSISGQLGGSIRSDWPTEGIMIWLTINKARLVETR